MVEETSRDTTTTKKVLSYQIIDNFLDTHEFDFLQTKVMEQEHSWYYGESVADVMAEPSEFGDLGVNPENMSPASKNVIRHRNNGKEWGTEGHKNTVRGLKLEIDRLEKIQVNMGYSGNLKKRLQNANKSNSDYAVIIGDEELEKNQAIVKNLINGNQENINLNNIVNHLKKILNLL